MLAMWIVVGIMLFALQRMNNSLRKLDKRIKKIEEFNQVIFEERLQEDAFIKRRIDFVLQCVNDRVLAVRILRAIKKYSIIYKLDADLVFSVVFKESSFNHKAISSKNAIGLMQVLPETAELVARYLGKYFYDLYEVEDNIEIGCAYLSLLLQYNDLEVALRKYYAGKYFESEMAEDYAKSILAFYRNFQRND